MKRLILITSMMALGLMGVGCSKTNSNSANNSNVSATATGGGSVVNPIIVDPLVTNPGTDPNQYQYSSGFTTDFTPVSLQAMSKYVSIPGNLVALNSPQNIKININLAQSEAGRYGGSVTISYVDNGIQRSGTFSAGMGRNPTYKNMYDNNKLQADYNYWFTWENELVFTGFFEDSWGAITIALTPEVTSGGGNDAEPLNVTYKGSIYFKNWTAQKTTPYRHCWHIYNNGVGDCRSNVIQTKCGLNPGVEAGYTLLGTFTNVDIKKAFNMN